MSIRVGISGFGRVGRVFIRSLFDKMKKNDQGIEIVAINDPNLSPQQMAYLFKYDTIHGEFEGKISVEDNILIIDNFRIQILQEKNPENIRWDNYKVQYVIESSGRFTTKEEASKHLKGGAQRVIITTESKNAPTFIMGVNEDQWTPDDKVFATSNEELNALLPIAMILQNNYGIEGITMTSIHSLTSTQNTIDGATVEKDWRKGRSAFNVIPQSLYIENTMNQLLPHLKKKICSIQYTVPFVDVSTLDVTMRLTRPLRDKREFYTLMKEVMKQKRFKTIIGMTEEQLVSSDIVDEYFSCMIDWQTVKVTHQGKYLRFVLWFDNEYGYTNRLIDMIQNTGMKEGGMQCITI